MTADPDRDPLAAGPGTERDTFEREEVAHELERPASNEQAVNTVMTALGHKLRVHRESAPGVEKIVVMFPFRPPTGSHTSVIVEGVTQARIEYDDPHAALEDAASFLQTALAAVRAQARRLAA